MVGGDPQGLAGEVAVQAEPRAALARGEAAGAPGPPGQRPEMQQAAATDRSAYGAGPQNQTPSRSNGTGDGDGVQGSTILGSAARRSSSRPKTTASSPVVVFARETAPVCSSRSTNTPARNPGIEPPWPTSVRPSTRSTCRPEPVGGPDRGGGVDAGGDRHLLEGRRRQHVTGVAEQERREPAEVGDRRPELPGGGHHARVVLGLGEDHVGPGVHRRALRGRRCRRGVVRVMPSGASTSAATASSQVVPRVRATSSPSRPNPRLE